jgi:hypothetical protein
MVNNKNTPAQDMLQARRQMDRTQQQNVENYTRGGVEKQANHDLLLIAISQRAPYPLRAIPPMQTPFQKPSNALPVVDGAQQMFGGGLSQMSGKISLEGRTIK